MAFHGPRKREPEDILPWTAVIAIDPGGTTGWSVLMVHPDSLADPDISILDNIEHFAQGQTGGDEFNQEKDLLELIDAWPDAAVVIEDFILRKQLRDRELLSPVRITAVVEFALKYQQRRMFKQQPSMAKSLATDERLRSWGLYVREGGEEHARDATRHGITFLRRAKEKQTLRRAAWPYHYEESA